MWEGVRVLRASWAWHCEAAFVTVPALVARRPKKVRAPNVNNVVNSNWFVANVST
jgi:hypothetical protein